MQRQRQGVRPKGGAAGAGRTLLTRAPAGQQPMINHVSLSPGKDGTFFPILPPSGGQWGRAGGDQLCKEGQGVVASDGPESIIQSHTSEINSQGANASFLTSAGHLSSSGVACP